MYIACLKVRGSGPETELIISSIFLIIRPNDWWFSFWTGCFIFHHSPGGREMRCVQQGGSGAGG